ncbi:MULTISPECIES: TRAP transporter substrate-binding protein DctP [unclassified Neptuniibacter]|uniref:TRAP transporter substrate-binding protein DctP n=1 Tax=unclassified Neptuniibacter TaxID=2630693 RepID=UPI0025DE6D6F|nr:MULTISPECIES: TRAP transporter substrate-binding protein DctP [unclassified Neptuniibacter]|tara:strand:- start:3280 stop:4350 length:1071 start_codon:yes stop_codon:yes gene_type:complete
MSIKLSSFKLLFTFFIIANLTACKEEEKPEVFTWQLQSQATQDSIDYKELKRFADNVRTMSSGRLNITPHPAGELASGPNIYSSVREGRIQMGNGWPNWWSAENPAWALMNAGPFDFMNLDSSMMFFLSGEGTKLANELSLPDGIVWRPAWWPGMEFGLLSKTEIKGLDDLNSKKVRIGPGLPSEVLAAAAGAYTLPTVPEEIRPALENGDLDAVEWTTAGGAWNLGLNDISRHAIVPAVWQPSVLADFLINKQAYDALPSDLKAILETAIKSYTLTTTMKAKVEDFEAFNLFVENGVKINKWSQEDLERWKIISESVLDEYGSRDPISRRIIEEKKAFKKVYMDYYQWFGPYDNE